MIEAVSCGGVVIYKWKILLLYKNQNGRYMGWVLPKGTVEENETYRQTALREVKEESGATGEIIKYVGKTQYTFKGSEDTVSKTVHWYLMSANSFYCKPQSEEYFADAGFYKFPIDILKRCPNIIGVCSANTSAKALRGALKSGFFTHIAARADLIKTLLE